MTNREEMDELFGEVGFAQADMAAKARIERQIGLTALLGDEERNASVGGGDIPVPAIPEIKEGSGSDAASDDLVEKKE